MAINNQVISNIIENQLIVVDEDSSIILTCGVQGVAGASGAVSYTNAEPTPITIGGIAAGTTFNAVALEDMWQSLLYPYQNPSFTAFDWTGRPSQLEVGDTITGGLKTFNWTTNNSDNVEPNSIQISQSNVGVLASGLANDSTESVNIGADLTFNVITTITWTISATNTNQGSFNRSVSCTWKWKVYYGESNKTTLTEADIEGLELESNTLKTARSGVYSAPAGDNGSYKFLCWPTSFGTINLNGGVTDGDTGYDIPMSGPDTVSVTNAFGVIQDYYVYRTYYPTASALTMVV